MGLLVRDARGLSTVEYLVLVCALIVAGLAAWRAFGATVVAETAEATAALPGDPREVDGAGAPVSGDGARVESTRELVRAVEEPTSFGHRALRRMTAAAGADQGELPDAPMTLPWSDTLWANRSQLFHRFAAQRDPRTWSCAQWYDMSDSERNVFLTITDRLQRTKLADGSSALSHVRDLVSVRGQNPDGGCGGANYNRVYLVVDEHLHDAMRMIAQHGATVRVNGQRVLQEDGFGWRPTTDLCPPGSPCYEHGGFTGSIETDRGGPRAQVHFFVDPRTGEAVTHTRPGIEGVRNGYLVEIDMDYNWRHDSSTECRYDGRRTGAEQYRDMVRGGSDILNFLPCDCPQSGVRGSTPDRRCSEPGPLPPSGPPELPPQICYPDGFPCTLDRDCCSNICSEQRDEHGRTFCF
jgi:hypothetical protein